MSLPDLRRQIDETDSRILELLSQRARLAQEVGHLKAAAKAEQEGGNASSVPPTPFFAPERERQIFERLRGLNQGPLPNDAIQAIFREIISASRALESPISVAYLGPPGTFSHRAALLKFGTSSEPKPADTIPDVFASVERGEAMYGVVPVENSTEGVVALSLDMFSKTSLKICAEVFVSVDHHLASRAGSLKAIKRLYAHPQSFAQSRNWLRENLGKIEVVDTSSNSKSAQLATMDSEGACITTDIAAEIYDLQVLAQHIEDSPHNRTRFLVIGNNEPRPSGRDKTSIYFSVRHKAGALLDALKSFDDNGINLTMIDSRPTKQMPWEYIFFADMQGHHEEPGVRAALKQLEEHSLFVTLLGSYPEAE